MEIYQRGYTVDIKDDMSPLTEADLASNDIILSHLKKEFPNIPILSEESCDIFKQDSNQLFWLVDPLDGTKEFIKKNDEFTVNIALIENHNPIMGVVSVPAKNIVYASFKNGGAYKFEKGMEPKKITVSKPNLNNLSFAVSRSHLDDKTKNFIKTYNATITQAGSSLKLAYVAEGIVDAYPRFGPTMIWDIAAGHAVLSEAGGYVIEYGTSLPLNYDLKSLKNKEFIACNSIFFI